MRRCVCMCLCACVLAYACVRICGLVQQCVHACVPLRDLCSSRPCVKACVRMQFVCVRTHVHVEMCVQQSGSAVLRHVEWGGNGWPWGPFVVGISQDLASPLKCSWQTPAVPLASPWNAAACGTWMVTYLWSG